MAMIDLQFNYPILGGQREALSRHIEGAMAESAKWMELPPYGGYTEHREAAAGESFKVVAPSALIDEPAKLE